MFVIVSGLIQMCWTGYTLALAVVVALAVSFAIAWSLLATVDFTSKLIKGEQIRLCSIRPIVLIEHLFHETETYLNEVLEGFFSWTVPAVQQCLAFFSKTIGRLTGGRRAALAVSA